MERLSGWFLATLQDGLLATWIFLSSSFVTTIATIFLGAFIALRAFYIQKRHERMADKYEKAFILLSTISDRVGVKDPSALKSDERANLLIEVTNLIATSKVYFGKDARTVLSTFTREIDALMRKKSTPEDADKVISSCYDGLTKTAEKDLRPNLWRFAIEFVSVFVNG